MDDDGAGPPRLDDHAVDTDTVAALADTDPRWVRDLMDQGIIRTTAGGKVSVDDVQT